MESSPATGTSGPSGPRAGFWRRFVAALVDGILVGVVSGILSALLDLDRDGMNLVSLLIGLPYYAYFEGSTGQTVGKRLLGIRVISLQGSGSIGYGRAVIRYFGRIVSGIVIFLGYLWMLWDKEKQTWHDKMAGSVVVPVADFPVGGSSTS